MGGIYLILCEANGKIYVGSTKNFKKRWGTHKGLLEIERHFNIHLQRAWLKYGKENFKFVVHEELGEFDKNFHFERENFWMDYFRNSGKILFNIARAGGGWGPETFLRKEEIGAKISKSLRLFSATLTQEERNLKFGKGKLGSHHTEEHNRKTSEARMNKKIG